MNKYQFDQWLRSHAHPEVQGMENMEAWVQNNIGASNNDFVGYLQRRLNEGAGLQARIQQDVKVDLSQARGGTGILWYLMIASNTGGVSLQGLRAHRLELLHQNGNEHALRLEGCLIDTLLIAGVNRIDIDDSWIGTLDCRAHTRGLSIRGGGILLIESGAAGSESPFAGSVFFDSRVYLPNKPGGRLIDAQPYRNMRAHMMKLENGPMVSRFHVLELAVERKQERLGFTRFISWAYEVLSNYGGSIFRPFAYWIGLMIFTCMVMFKFDAAIIRPEVYGWLASVGRTGHWRALERAALLTLQGTFNPIGIFGTAGIVLPKSGWAAMWMFAHGVLSAALAALFFLALTRGFKMG